MKRIAFGLGPFGTRQLNVLEFTCAILIVCATLEAGSTAGVSALLQRPASSLVVPYMLFLLPCALIAPIIFAYRANAERPNGARAKIFAGGCGIFVAALSAALGISLSVLGAPTAPVGEWLLAGALATAVGTVVGYRQALAALGRRNPRGAAGP